MIQVHNENFLDKNINVAKLSNCIELLFSRSDLGFLKISAEDTTNLIETNCSHLKKFKQIIVIGMGGSSLGAQCLTEALASKSKIIFWNSSDPDTLKKKFSDLSNLEEIHFLIISKSGNTIESMLISNFALGELERRKLPFHYHVSIITEDKESPIFNLAKQHNIQIFFHPTDVGGRFSVFTIVGLLPAYLDNIDISAILKGANKALKAKNEIFQLTQSLLSPINRGDTAFVFWPYLDTFKYFTHWLQQLWAESLGKKYALNSELNAIIPIPTFCVGTKNQHSILQLFADQPENKSFLFIRLKTKKYQDEVLKNYFDATKYLDNTSLNKVFDLQALATQDSLNAKNAKTMSINIETLDEITLGYLMMLFQVSIGAISEYLQINAYDQPAVEYGKQLVLEKLSLDT